MKTVWKCLNDKINGTHKNSEHGMKKKEQSDRDHLRVMGALLLHVADAGSYKEVKLALAGGEPSVPVARKYGRAARAIVTSLQALPAVLAGLEEGKDGAK